MNILDLYQRMGLTAKRAASTHGGEYAGPCQLAGLILLLGLGVPDRLAAEQLGLDRSTATRWRSRLAGHGEFCVMSGDRAGHGGPLDHSRLD